MIRTTPWEVSRDVKLHPRDEVDWHTLEGVRALREAFATNKKESVLANSLIFSGEGGIRTPGPVTVNGFQDRRDRPLCHLSNADANIG